MARDPDLIPLMDACRELARLHGQPVDYNVFWRVVARGEVPADRLGRGLYVRRSVLPLAATALGLTTAATPAVPTRTAA